MEFEVLDNIKVRGEIYEKGNTVTMSRERAEKEKLVEKGILAVVGSQDEPEEQTEPEKEPEEEMFECPYCEREFTSQRGLTIHMNACDEAPETDE